MDSAAQRLLQGLRAEGRQGAAALLADPGRALVGLDFDGTLAPIVERPEDARAHPGALPALRRLTPALGRVAIVTGRPVRSVLAYTGLQDAPGLERLAVLGHYGFERWDGRGGVSHPEPPPGVAEVRAALPALITSLSPGAHLEDKGAALAVHTRQTPDPVAGFEALRGPLTRLAAEHGLALEPGRLVLELRPPGMDKGVALRGLADELGRPSAVVFVGDDLGDLAAFEQVARMREEGTPGVLVCSGSDEVSELAARADLVVDGPAGVVGWLTLLADALSR